MRVLSKRATSEKINYSVPHLDRMVSEGRFPRKVKLGPNKVGFLETEVDEWITNRVRERDGADNMLADPGNRAAERTEAGKKAEE